MYFFSIRKCIKSSSTPQIVFLTCFAQLISSSLPPFTALAFISFWSLLLLHFAHHKCTHNAHTRTTHTHTTNTTRASCLIHNLCQKHIGAPIRCTGNATIFIYTHMCVCLCVCAGIPLGIEQRWGNTGGGKGTTTRDNKRPRLTLELRSYCHLLLPG